MIPREAYRDVPEEMRLALPAPFHPAELEGIFGPVNGVEGAGGGECLVCYSTDVQTSGSCKHHVCSHCYVHLGFVGATRCPCCRTEIPGLYVSILCVVVVFLFFFCCFFKWFVVD